MDLPQYVDYPVIAIGDLHGLRGRLHRLLTLMGRQPVWRDAPIVFLGDFVDRGRDVPGAIDLVLAAMADRPGSSAVMGNHDLALVRAAGLDGQPPSPYWIERYRDYYDHDMTFTGYLGQSARLEPAAWLEDLDRIRAAMPGSHVDFLANLRWMVEAPGHLFLHNGLSHELDAEAEEQVRLLHGQLWDRPHVAPVPGTLTEGDWRPDYPVWIGSDRSLADRPLPHPRKVQVSGHMHVDTPEFDAVRIRIDTSDRDRLTACLLRSPDAAPEFLSSDG